MVILTLDDITAVEQINFKKFKNKSAGTPCLLDMDDIVFKCLSIFHCGVDSFESNNASTASYIFGFAIISHEVGLLFYKLKAKGKQRMK